MSCLSVSCSPRLLAKISLELKGQQLNEITRLLESPAAWAKAWFKGGVEQMGQRSGDGDLAWCWELTEKGKGRLKSGQQEGGEDGNAGVAQGGFMQELGIGSEASEGCHRRGSAPYSSLALVHHTHKSGGAQGSDKTTTKSNISWAAFARLCNTYLLEYHA